MRKEITLAIIFGIVFGLVVAFGAWRANLTFKKPPEASPPPTQTPAPSSSQNISLVIQKPFNLSVTDIDTLEISGLTQQNAYVIVSAEKNDYLFKADQEGKFSEKIDLAAGVNEINAIAYNNNQLSSSQRIVIVYSSQYFSEMKTDTTPAPSPNSSPWEISEITKEKIQKTVNAPRAFLGTITDISEGTLQIAKYDFNTTKSEINQISTSKDTTYVKSGQEDKTLKFTDLAIGDFIVAMGIPGDNSVLKAGRILITSPIAPTLRKVYFAKVVTAGKEIVAQTESGEIKLITDKTTKITTEDNGKFSAIKITEIPRERLILFSGLPDNNGIKTRLIHLLP